MRKNIYIPDDKKHVFEEAEKLFKEDKSLSQLIIEALEKEIKFRKEYKTFILIHEDQPVKLIGKQVASYKGCYITINDLFSHHKYGKSFAEIDNPMLNALHGYEKDEKLIKEYQSFCENYKNRKYKGIKENYWYELSTLNSMGFSLINFHEFYAFLTLSGKLYLNVKYNIEFDNSKPNYISIVIHIYNIWEFIDTGKLESFMTTHDEAYDPTDRPLPVKFVEEIKLSLGDDYIERVII